MCLCVVRVCTCGWACGWVDGYDHYMCVFRCVCVCVCVCVSSFLADVAHVMHGVL
jgi:hypothetical protein